MCLTITRYLMTFFSVFVFFILFRTSLSSTMQERKCQYIVDSDCKSEMDIVFVIDTDAYLHDKIEPIQMKEYLFKLVCDLYIDFSYVRVGIIQKFGIQYTDRKPLHTSIPYRRELNLTGNSEEVFEAIDNLSLERVYHNPNHDSMEREHEETIFQLLQQSVADSKVMLRQFSASHITPSNSSYDEIQRPSERESYVVILTDLSEKWREKLIDQPKNETTSVLVGDTGEYIPEIACADVYTFSPTFVCLREDGGSDHLTIVVKGIGFPYHQGEHYKKTDSPNFLYFCQLEGVGGTVLPSSRAFIRDTHSMKCKFDHSLISTFWKNETDGGDSMEEVTGMRVLLVINIGTLSWIRKMNILTHDYCELEDLITKPPKDGDNDDDDDDTTPVLSEKEHIDIFHLVGFPYFRFSILAVLMSLFSSFLICAAIILVILFLSLIIQVRRRNVTKKMVTQPRRSKSRGRMRHDGNNNVESYFVLDEEEETMESEERYFMNSARKKEKLCKKKNSTFMIGGKHVRIDWGNKGISWRSPFGSGNDMGVGSNQ